MITMEKSLYEYKNYFRHVPCHPRPWTARLSGFCLEHRRVLTHTNADNDQHRHTYQHIDLDLHSDHDCHTDSYTNLNRYTNLHAHTYRYAHPCPIVDAEKKEKRTR